MIILFKQTQNPQISKHRRVGNYHLFLRFFLPPVEGYCGCYAVWTLAATAAEPLVDGFCPMPI